MSGLEQAAEQGEGTTSEATELPVVMSAADLVRNSRPNAFMTRVPGGRVSTLYRESSAMADFTQFFFETMCFLDGVPGIAWHSAASDAREADRQHALAVRWFTRRPAA